MSDNEKITAQRTEFINLFHAEDIPGMSQLVTDNHLIMAPNQPERVGLDAAREFWQWGFSTAKTSMEIDSKELTVAGDVAIDRFNWTQHIELRNNGNTIDDEGNCIWIWRRGSDGTWKIESAIWNSNLPNAGTWAGG